MLWMLLTKWGFPKIRDTLLGVPIIRIIVFWGLYWGSLILGELPNSSGMAMAVVSLGKFASGHTGFRPTTTASLEPPSFTSCTSCLTRLGHESPTRPAVRGL